MMAKRTLLITVCVALAAALVQPVGGQQASSLTSPKQHFGFEPGDDGTYAAWDQVVAYYEKLDKESDRVETRVLLRSVSRYFAVSSRRADALDTAGRSGALSLNRREPASATCQDPQSGGS